MTAIKTYPDLYRDKGEFTVQYWSKVRMLGKYYKIASAIDKMSNIKVNGLPILAAIGTANEVMKLINKALLLTVLSMPVISS